jgi:hypothetical protein
MNNERIKELALEAGFYANPDVEKFEKFAELIVRECADIAKNNVMNISTYRDAEFVDEQIKKHFGVEE